MKKFSSRNAFFDSISGKWDTWEDLVLQKKRILKGLDEFGLGPDEVVLDVGCGTGNVTIAILDKLSDAGRVHAVGPFGRNASTGQREGAGSQSAMAFGGRRIAPAGERFPRPGDLLLRLAAF